MDTGTKFKTVEEYFSTLSPDVRDVLEDLRKTIKQAAPKAEEVISYNMPAIKQGKAIVYYAAHKEHIGFYPTSSPMMVFKDQLAAFKTSKGAIQFPIDKPIPKKLVKDIVRYRLTQVQEKEINKK